MSIAAVSKAMLYHVVPTFGERRQHCARLGDAAGSGHHRRGWKPFLLGDFPTQAFPDGK